MSSLIMLKILAQEDEPMRELPRAAQKLLRRTLLRSRWMSHKRTIISAFSTGNAHTHFC
jgi:hypothetical protein